MRGRLFIAGVDARTPVSDVLDVLTVVVMDTPGEALGKWRSGIERAAFAAKAAAARTRAPAGPAGAATAGRYDRSSWGLAPEQIEATRRFHAALEGRL
jgi:hypothetical protein